MKQQLSFDRIVQDFRTLDWEDPGLWPLLPRLIILAVIFLVVLVAAYFIDWDGRWDELKQKRQEEATLKDDWLSKKRQTVNLDEYRKQLAEIDRQFGALLKQLPNKTEMDNLLVDVNQAGLGRGLQFELWKPGAEQMKAFYAEVPVSISVTGSYHDLGNFIGDVAKLPRIVTLNDISISSENGAVLKMNATAVTYRYLDQSEQAAQSKLAAAERKKKAGAK